MARPDPLANRKGLMVGALIFQFSYSAPRVNCRPTTTVYNLNAAVVRETTGLLGLQRIPKHTPYNLSYAIPEGLQAKNFAHL
jgi:hypothetical protein